MRSAGSTTGALLARTRRRRAEPADAGLPRPPGELAAWTEERWAGLPPYWDEKAHALTDRQRLLLGLTVFGRASYRVVAAVTDLPEDEVSAECAVALQRLSGDETSAHR